MAKTETTVRGYVYTVTSPNGGTVTDAEGKLNKPVGAGDQVTVQAPSDSLTCDDDDAVIYKVNFNDAASVLRLLGGGDKLPAGYTRLEFLESTGTQRIDTGIAKPAIAKYRIRFVRTNVLQLMGFNSAYDKWGVSDKGKYRNSTNVTAFEAGGVDFITYNDLNYPTVLFSCNGDVESFVANNSYPGGIWSIFAQKDNTYNCYARLYENSYSAKNGTLLGEFIPVIDALGKPCMFDLVSKQPFRNAGSGQFVAGVGTVAQLTALLRNLPASGGTLTLSLPAEANTPEVADMLQACHDTKGWTLTVHEYRPAEASTYSLRRVRNVVWCRRELSDLGSYVDADGFRWQIERCAAIFGALGQDPAAYCYTPFDSVEQAAEYWELQPYVDPEAMDELMGDNGTLEQGGTENTSPETNS